MLSAQPTVSALMLTIAAVTAGLITRGPRLYDTGDTHSVFFALPFSTHAGGAAEACPRCANTLMAPKGWFRQAWCYSMFEGSTTADRWAGSHINSQLHCAQLRCTAKGDSCLQGWLTTAVLCSTHCYNSSSSAHLQPQTGQVPAEPCS
jgi:hypothetical protein